MHVPAWRGLVEPSGATCISERKRVRKAKILFVLFYVEKKRQENLPLKTSIAIT